MSNKYYNLDVDLTCPACLKLSQRSREHLASFALVACGFCGHQWKHNQPAVNTDTVVERLLDYIKKHHSVKSVYYLDDSYGTICGNIAYVEDEDRFFIVNDNYEWVEL